MKAVAVACCYLRPLLDSEDYWFGLFKIIALQWVGTRWYDGNPSTYRPWATGFPKYDNSICISYSSTGFKDAPCTMEYYFTCRQPGDSSM